MTAPPIEVREQDGQLTLTGYASVTGVWYDVSYYREMIQPGAFRRTLANPDLDCALLWAHGGWPLARVKAGTLKLSEDAVGLRFAADLDPQDPDSQRIARKLARGDLSGEMSFAFRANQQTWNDDYSERVIIEADIQRGDVSVVLYGANPLTSSEIVGRSASDEVSLELRKHHAEAVGKRVTVRGSAVRASSCARCGGEGEITIRCPNCGGADEEAAAGARGVSSDRSRRVAGSRVEAELLAAARAGREAGLLAEARGARGRPRRTVPTVSSAVEARIRRQIEDMRRSR